MYSKCVAMAREPSEATLNFTSRCKARVRHSKRCHTKIVRQRIARCREAFLEGCVVERHLVSFYSTASESNETTASLIASHTLPPGALRHPPPLAVPRLHAMSFTPVHTALTTNRRD